MAPPSSRPSANNSADWTREAEAAYANGRFAAALHLFSEALSHAPDDANLQPPPLAACASSASMPKPDGF